MKDQFTRGMKDHEWDVGGGKGGANITYLLASEDVAAKAKITEYRAIRLDKGAWCGWHEVKAKTECWYIAAGEGVYKSDIAEFPVHAGDTVSRDKGGFQSLKNTGDGDLTYVAITID